MNWIEIGKKGQDATREGRDKADDRYSNTKYWVVKNYFNMLISEETSLIMLHRSFTYMPVLMFAISKIWGIIFKFKYAQIFYKHLSYTENKSFNFIYTYMKLSIDILTLKNENIIYS